MKDLTVGNPTKVLWKFCLPLFGSIIFQQLYNLADSIVAGQFIGENALGAVSNSYEITLIFLAFATGCNVAGSVIASRLFGAKKFSELKTAIYTTFISTAILTVTLMLLGILLYNPLLKGINTREEIFKDSSLYLKIYIWGLPFLFFYNLANGLFSALGDSVTPFIFLAFSSVANIGLDILLVAKFNMGVAGVAWATFICQGVSCVGATTLLLFKLTKIKTQEKPKLFSTTSLKAFVTLAIPTTMQQSFVSVGNILVQRVVNSFGIEAGYGAAIKLHNLLITSFSALANGVSSYTSQNLGANKPERIFKGFTSGIKMAIILFTPIILLYIFFGKYCLVLFAKDFSLSSFSSENLHAGIMLLRIISPFDYLSILKLFMDGVLRGAGRIKEFTFATFVDLFLRVIFANIFSKFWGTTGIWLAWPIGWVATTVITGIFFVKGDWFKKRKLYSAQSDLPTDTVVE